MNTLSVDTVTCMSNSRRDFGSLDLLKPYRSLTNSNYNILTELHTPNITVTTAHITSSQSSLGVSW
jgi:hypothetical protein